MGMAQKKALGAIVGSVMALCLATDAMAQADDAVDTTVVLEEGSCSIAIVEADIDFGIWTFDDSMWVPDVERGGSTGGTFGVENTSNGRVEDCTVQVDATPLSDGDAQPSFVDVSLDPGGEHSAGSSSDASTGTDATIWLDVDPESSKQVEIDILLPIADDNPPATYSGIIQVTDISAP